MCHTPRAALLPTTPIQCFKSGPGLISLTLVATVYVIVQFEFTRPVFV